MSTEAASRKSLLLDCLAIALRPIVRLMLSCGLSYTEFTTVVRTVYVRVATQEYGLRGRPTNISRVSALTGIPRRIVSRIRAQPLGPVWSPDQEQTPINSLIHYWRYDPDFSEGPGIPKRIAVEGQRGFDALAQKYLGGIPASVLRKELLRQGIVVRHIDGTLALAKVYAFPNALDEDFLRNWSFSLGSLGGTLAHNACLVGSDVASEDLHIRQGRFQQIAWSRRLNEPEAEALRLWTRTAGHGFIQMADKWIANLEGPNPDASESDTSIAGVGVYFFVDS